jgi:hypothetical protein
VFSREAITRSIGGELVTVHLHRDRGSAREDGPAGGEWQGGSSPWR